MTPAFEPQSASTADSIGLDRGADARHAHRFREARPAPAAVFRAHAVPVPPSLARRPSALRIVYRAIESLLALACLLLASPLMVLEAILIKLDSPGPVLFWQRRVGQSSIRRGRELMNRADLIPPGGGFQADDWYLVPETLNFVKFRTMYVDARERFPELYEVGFETHEGFLSSYYKLENDPRVTRAGRWFRRTTLDELPNLLLVITGQMEFVGPRPEGPWFLPYYTPEHMLKFAVKPGVTGLAQSSGRGQLQIGAQIALDLEYVGRRSVWLDIKILFHTLLGVLKQKGAF